MGKSRFLILGILGGMIVAGGITLAPAGAVSRSIIVAGAICIWFATQGLIGARKLGEEAIGDAVHQWSAGLNAKLHQNPKAANALLIVSSMGIDAMGIFLILTSIFGGSFKPFAGLMALFGLRQISQYLCALKPPDGVIWRYPGFPSIFVTYGVGNDFFFSGHTAIAAYGCLELCAKGGIWIPLGIGLLVFEAMTVLVLRAHYTMDVLTGLLAAGLAHELLNKF